MKKAFYYAELDLTVSLVDGKDDILSNLTKNELQLLSIQIHSIITNFLLGRALYAADSVESLERIKNAGKKDKKHKDGG